MGSQTGRARSCSAENAAPPGRDSCGSRGCRRGDLPGGGGRRCFGTSWPAAARRVPPAGTPGRAALSRRGGAACGLWSRAAPPPRPGARPAAPAVAPTPEERRVAALAAAQAALQGAPGLGPLSDSLGVVADRARGALRDSARVAAARREVDAASAEVEARAAARASAEADYDRLGHEVERLTAALERATAAREAALARTREQEDLRHRALAAHHHAVCALEDLELEISAPAPAAMAMEALGPELAPLPRPPRRGGPRPRGPRLLRSPRRPPAQPGLGPPPRGWTLSSPPRRPRGRPRARSAALGVLVPSVPVAGRSGRRTPTAATAGPRTATAGSGGPCAGWRTPARTSSA